MRPLRHMLVLLLVLLAGCRTPVEPDTHGRARTDTDTAPAAICVRVVDGDTIVVRLPEGKRERVRLRRVNAPELHEPGGPEARAALAERLEGRAVRLQVYARDRYGRLVAEVEPVH